MRYTKSMNIFYTYAYLREDGTPYYIGKGKNNRAWSSANRNTPTPSDSSRILILKKNLSEEDALRHEIYMIAVLGRKDTCGGLLYNFTDGGEGCSGRVVSTETREKISRSHRGRKGSMTGRSHSEETRQKMSETHKGKKFSSESRKKMSEAKQNMSEKTKAKMSQAAIGRKVSEDTKEKIREKMKTRVFTEEHRRRLSESRRKKK
jgi:hypothetical protein